MIGIKWWTTSVKRGSAVTQPVKKERKKEIPNVS
jgi:hypothetical protein